MAVLNNNGIRASAVAAAAGGGATPFTGHEVKGSVLIDEDQETYLTHTRGGSDSETDLKKVTISLWIRRSALGQYRQIFRANQGAGQADNTNFQFRFDDDDKIRLRMYTTSTLFKLSPKFKDTGAWYHLVLALDSTQSTQADRCKFYVNGEHQATGDIVSGNQEWAVNKAGAIRYLMNDGTDDGINNGYLAEVFIIDGYQYAATDFAETDTVTGQWKPKAFTGNFGSGGCYYKFADASSITTDSSGNNHTLTATNFTTAGTGVAVNWSTESPQNYGTDTGAGGEVKGTYPTLNMLQRNANHSVSFGGRTLGNGNSDHKNTGYTMPLPRTGKWYFEIEDGDGSNDMGFILKSSKVKYSDFINSTVGDPGLMIRGNGFKYIDGTETAWSDFGGFTENQFIGIALDMDNGAWYTRKHNGTWTDSGDPTSGSSKTGATFTTLLSDLVGSDLWQMGMKTQDGSGHSINFGARPFQLGNAPSGYKCLCSTNLPDSVGVADTDLNNAGKYFKTLKYTGNDSSQDLDVGFSPEIVWQKSKTNDALNYIHTKIGGTNNRLSTDGTYAENDTISGAVTGWLSDGIEIGSNDQINSNNETYAAWFWNAGDSRDAISEMTGTPPNSNYAKIHAFDGSLTTKTTGTNGGSMTWTPKGGIAISTSMRMYASKEASTDNCTVTFTDGSTFSTWDQDNTAKWYTITGAGGKTLSQVQWTHNSSSFLVYAFEIDGSIVRHGNDPSTAGSLNPTVSFFSQSAGVEIMEYEGDSGASTTIGHNLGALPHMIIMKAVNGTTDWKVWHRHLEQGSNGANAVINFNGSSGAGQSSWPDSGDSEANHDCTTTLFQPNRAADDYLCRSGWTYLAQLFTSIDGFSMFGRYVGNGSSNGPYVHLGFRPSMLYTKKDGSSNWNLFDDLRPGYNETNGRLFPNSSTDEATGSSSNNQISITSYGFKLTGSNSDTNGTNEEYIFAAWAGECGKVTRAFA